MARRDDPGPYSLETLAALPVPELITRDADVLRARYVAWFEHATGRTLYPAQVEMLLIDMLAYAMSVLGEEGQIVAEQHLVAKAAGIGLGQLGANRSTPRLPASKARATLRFTIAAARAVPTTIVAGTRVSAGSGGMVFLTLGTAVIAPGLLDVEIAAEAAIEGAAGNGFLAGQISTMLDPLPGVAATNVATSEGGADEEDLELWRLRIANAFDRVSSAGGRGWYRETVMSVSTAIVDVAVVRPAPCYIDLYPLTVDGPAGPALRDQVAAVFETPEALEIRFGDAVTVKPPVAVVAAPVLTVRARGFIGGVQVPAAAVGNLVLAEWRERLGSAVAPSEIEDRVKKALKGLGVDVVDVEVSAMPFDQLAPQEFLAAVPFAAEAVIVEPVDG